MALGSETRLEVSRMGHNHASQGGPLPDQLAPKENKSPSCSFHQPSGEVPTRGLYEQVSGSGENDWLNNLRTDFYLH